MDSDVDENPQDLLLGGLFPIHKQGEGGDALCGDIQDEDGDDDDEDNHDNEDDNYDDHHQHSKVRLLL